MIRQRLIVTGRVRNVFYRACFTEQANALFLHGCVRTRADGEGPNDVVERIVVLAREGSPASRVADVVVEEADGPVLSGFEQRPTA